MCNLEKVRVLVVDDSSVWRASVIRHLTNAGMRVIGIASDGVEAILKVEQLQPDLVLMDVKLPCLDGIQAASVIHDASPSAKVIFVSATEDPAVIEAAMKTGACDYVIKALTGSHLLESIKRCIRGATTGHA